MHLRCPHCHNKIEIVGEQSLSDVLCPSCGSQFSLISGETTTHHPTRRSIGHFELLEQVGAGHFGVVWKAHDGQLGRTVAIKLPRRDRLDSAETEFFLRDARAAAQLRHPNVVAVHEVGRDGDSVYIVSDFIEGADLKSWLTGQRLTTREAAELMIKIAEAVQHAHEKGVIHRDLKPGNILMDLNGQPHVADFGLAKRDAGEITMTVSGQILGTPAYMSPEQAQGKAHEADARSDVYSLGVILFELLTGELPFRGEARMLIVQILKDDPPSPRKLNARIARDLETISLKCLEKEPTRRYQTAQEIVDELQRFLRGEPIHASPVNRLERAWRWCKRKPLAAALVAIALALAVGGPFVAITQAHLRQQAKLMQERAQVEAGRAVTAAATATQANEQLRKKMYNAEMNMAFRSYHLGDFSQAQRLLANYTPTKNNKDIRRFEWHLLSRLCRPPCETITAHVICPDLYWFSVMRVFPDRRTIAWGAWSGALVVWDLHEKKELARVAAHAGQIYAIDVSSDSQFILTTGKGAVRVWRYPTCELVHNLPGFDSNVIIRARFSPDGSQVVAGGSDGAVRMWNTINGQETHVMHEKGAVNVVAFSPDGGTLATCGNEPGAVRLWRVGKYEEPVAIYENTGRVWNACFSPDSTLLAIGGEGFEWINLQTGERSKPGDSPHRSRVTALAFSPDGRTLATASADRTIKIWGISNGRILDTLRGHDDRVSGLEFIDSHRRLLSCGEDDTVRVWDLSEWERRRTIGAHSGYVQTVAFAPGGATIATAGDDGTVHAWNLASRQQVACYLGASEFGKAHCATYVPGSKILATGWQDGQIRLLDSNSLALIKEYPALNSPVETISVCPDGSAVAAADRNKNLLLFDLKNGDRLEKRSSFDGYYGPFGSLAFTPDGQSLLYSFYNVVMRFDWRSNKRPRNLYVGHSDGITTLAVSPCGKYLAAAAWYDEIRLWQIDDSQRRDNPLEASEGIISSRLTLIGHTADISALCFSPDSSLLASVSVDGVVIFWDTATGEQTGYLSDFCEGSVTSAAFSPNGREFITSDNNGVVYLWTADQTSAQDSNSKEASVNSLPAKAPPEFDPGIDTLTEPALHRLRQLVGTEQSVEFNVAEAGQYHRTYYLNSMPNFLHPCVVRVMVLDKEFERLHELGIQGSRDLLGRRIRVVGIVDRVRDSLRIYVEDAGRQLKIYDRDGQLLSLTEPQHGDDMPALKANWQLRFYALGKRNELSEPADWPAVLAHAPLHQSESEQVDFSWGVDSPHLSVPRDFFATVAEATTTVAPGQYEIVTVSDDAVRVFIDDKLVLENWTPHAAMVDRVKVTLTEKQHRIRVEHYEVGLDARLKFCLRRLDSEVVDEPQGN